MLPSKPLRQITEDSMAEAVVLGVEEVCLAEAAVLQRPAWVEDEVAGVAKI